MMDLELDTHVGSMPRKNPIDSFSKAFEERTTATLEAQDRTLERLDKKLEAPVFNGGFEDLMTKVNKIESIQTQLQVCQEKTSEQVTAIHTAIYDPEKGLYAKVKAAISWIDRANGIIKGLLALLATGLLTGAGKLIYDLLSGHIQYTP